MAKQWIVLWGVIMGSLLAVGDREAQSAEWSAEPSLSVKGEYNSNLVLSIVSPTEVVGYWVSPGVKFAGSIENMEVSGRAAADFVGYQGDRDVSFTNLFFPLSLRYRGEQNSLRFNGGLTRDNTLRSELLETGVVVAFTQRNLWTASPSWTHDLNERAALVAGYQFVDATYEDGLRFRLVDYDVHSGNVGLSYQVAERTQASLTGIATLFQPESNVETQTYGAQLSGTHDFSDTLRATAMVGPRVIRSTSEDSTQTLEDDELVWVFNASLRKQLERTAFSIDGGRTLNPSGFGLLLQTDRVGVNIEHQLTETLKASISGLLLLASAVATTGLNISFADNRYVSAEPKLTWRMNEWWATDLSYTYRRRDVEGFDEPGISHAVTFSVTYTPAKFSVGR
jgi:hypothetical protein